MLPRARATRLRVFSGQSVQRWPRTRRSSDPLQIRASGPYFLPKAQIDHLELESGVGIRVRSRSDALATPAARSSATIPRLCMRCACGYRRTSLGRLDVLFCSYCCPPTHRFTVGCSRSWRAKRSNRSCEHLCFQLLSSRFAAAAPHPSPTTNAHVIMSCPSCLCLLSHRSSTFVQRL